MKKYVICILLCFLMSLTFVGCSKSEVNAPSDKEEMVKDEGVVEDENTIEEKEDVMFENNTQPLIQRREDVYTQQNQVQYAPQPQYYEQKPVQRTKPSNQKVVSRATKQYYAASTEVSRDKFTSTMETSLRRSIKIVCAERGIMFAQFVEDACREKLQREGIR